MAVKSNLESTIFDVRKNIGPLRMAVMQPHRHLPNPEFTMTGRNADKEHFLAGGMNMFIQQPGKYFRQPRTAGEDVCATGDKTTITGFNAVEFAAPLRWDHGRGRVLNSLLDHFSHQQLNSPARHQDAALGFQHSTGNVMKRKLWVAYGNFTCGESPGRNTAAV